MSNINNTNGQNHGRAHIVGHEMEECSVVENCNTHRCIGGEQEEGGRVCLEKLLASEFTTWRIYENVWKYVHATDITV